MIFRWPYTHFSCFKFVLFPSKPNNHSVFFGWNFKLVLHKCINRCRAQMVKHADIILYYIFFGGIFREVTKTKFSNKKQSHKRRDRGIKGERNKTKEEKEIPRLWLCKGNSLLFDLFKAFDKIKSSHKSDSFSQKSPIIMHLDQSVGQLPSQQCISTNQ